MGQRSARGCVLLLFCLTWMLFQPQMADAYDITFGYSHLTLREDGIHYELELLPGELSHFFILDDDQDGSVTIAEAERKRQALEKLVAQGISVNADGAVLMAKLGSIEMIEQGAGIPMIKLGLDYESGKKVDELVVKYGLLFDVSPVHHNFATITAIDGSTKEHDFDTKHREIKLYTDPSSMHAVAARIQIPAWLLILLPLAAAGIAAYLIKLRITRRIT